MCISEAEKIQSENVPSLSDNKTVPYTFSTVTEGSQSNNTTEQLDIEQRTAQQTGSSTSTTDKPGGYLITETYVTDRDGVTQIQGGAETTQVNNVTLDNYKNDSVTENQQPSEKNTESLDGFDTSTRNQVESTTKTNVEEPATFEGFVYWPDNVKQQSGVRGYNIGEKSVTSAAYETDQPKSGVTQTTPRDYRTDTEIVSVSTMSEYDYTDDSLTSENAEQMDVTKGDVDTELVTLSMVKKPAQIRKLLMYRTYLSPVYLLVFWLICLISWLNHSYWEFNKCLFKHQDFQMCDLKLSKYI